MLDDEFSEIILAVRRVFQFGKRLKKMDERCVILDTESLQSQVSHGFHRLVKTLTGETKRVAVPHDLPQRLARLVPNLPSTSDIGCTLLTAYEPSLCHHDHNTRGWFRAQCGTILHFQTTSTVHNTDGSRPFHPQVQLCRPQDEDNGTKELLIGSTICLEIRWLA